MESCIEWLPHSGFCDLVNSEDLKQIAKICIAMQGKGNATRTDGLVVPCGQWACPGKFLPSTARQSLCSSVLRPWPIWHSLAGLTCDVMTCWTRHPEFLMPWGTSLCLSKNLSDAGYRPHLENHYPASFTSHGMNKVWIAKHMILFIVFPIKENFCKILISFTNKYFIVIKVCPPAIMFRVCVFSFLMQGKPTPIHFTMDCQHAI